MASNACPDESALVAWVERRLGAEDVAVITRHIDECAACRTIVGALAATVTPAVADTFPRAGAHAPLARSTIVGRYVVLDRVGEGGMGVVYAAWDPELDRRVALKLVRAQTLGVNGAEARQRLLREAQAMARVSHPNVVPVFDVGTFDDEVFVAMEFVRAKTLDQWLAAAPRSWSEILDVFRQAAEGLSAIHSVGLVHRDVKPGNILVGDDGRVRVSDFGLAQLGAVALDSPELASLAVDSLTLTRTGVAVGTPAYMSLEQLAGTSDARTDQFSLCVSLYEALYGERPFAGRTLEELRRSLSAGPPQSSPRRGNVPGWLRKVVLKGLSPSADERHSSMDALLSALADDPAVRTRRRGAFAAVAALVAVAAAGGVVIPRSNRARCELRSEELGRVWSDDVKAKIRAAFAAAAPSYGAASAERIVASLDGWTSQWSAARTDACLATNVRGEQSSELLDRRMQCFDARLRELSEVTRLLETADAALVERAVDIPARLVGADACASAQLLASGMLPPAPGIAASVVELRGKLAAARAAELAGRAGEAMKLGEEVLPAARQLDYAPLVAETLYRLCESRAVGAKKETAETCLEAAAVARRAGDAQLETDALAHVVKEVGADAKRFSEAVTVSELASSAASAAKLSPRVLGRIKSGLAYAHKQKGDFAKAVELFQEALRLLDSDPGSVVAEKTSALSDLGGAYAQLGKVDEAVDASGRALKLAGDYFGEGHPRLAVYENGYGLMLWRANRLDDALAHLKRSLAIRAKTDVAGHPGAARTRNNIGLVLYRMGRYEEAEAEHRAAIDGLLAIHGEQHRETALCIDNRAMDLTMLGRYDEALKEHERARGILEKLLGADHPELAYTLTAIARAYRLSGQPALAIAPIEKAITLREKSGSDPVELAKSRFELAQALVAAKREEARAVALAKSAEPELVAGGARAEKDLEAVRSWLAARAR